jgi:MFS family permease
MRLTQQRWRVVAAPFATTFAVANPFAAFGVFLPAYGLGAAAGRLAFGAGSDRLGTPITMQVSFALQIAALVALLVAPSRPLLPPLMAVYGFGFAGSDTVFVRVIPDVFGLRALGAIMGVLALGWRGGAGLGPSLTGFVYDLTGSYALPFGAAPVATPNQLRAISGRYGETNPCAALTRPARRATAGGSVPAAGPPPPERWPDNGSVRRVEGSVDDVDEGSHEHENKHGRSEIEQHPELLVFHVRDDLSPCDPQGAMRQKYT